MHIICIYFLINAFFPTRKILCTKSVLIMNAFVIYGFLLQSKHLKFVYFNVSLEQNAVKSMSWETTVS